MSWKVIIIKTGSLSAEMLSDALLEQGALSVDISDAASGSDQEQPLYGEPGLPDDGLIWRNAEIAGMFDRTVNEKTVMQAITAGLQLPEMPVYRVETVEEQDWVRLTQSQFEPICISPRLWIVPTWHQPPDPSAINLILDPGLAFGTGSHPTTQLCLSWLDKHLKQNETLLDYGCGSGVLAIAALKLGAVRVTGIDIDDHAVKASGANALLNGCDPTNFSFATPYQTADKPPDNPEQYDVVMANILSNPLIILAPMLAQMVRNGGCIVLSGILEEQAETVVMAYKQWFEIQIDTVQDGWVLLTGTCTLST